jgi:hypothetical protein
MGTSCPYQIEMESTRKLQIDALSSDNAVHLQSMSNLLAIAIFASIFIKIILDVIAQEDKSIVLPYIFIVVCVAVSFSYLQQVSTNVQDLTRIHGTDQDYQTLLGILASALFDK